MRERNAGRGYRRRAKRTVVERMLSRLPDPGFRARGQRGAVRQVQLSFNVLTVTLDRFDANAEAGRDLPGAHARADELEDLQLPVAQASGLAFRPAPPASEGL